MAKQNCSSQQVNHIHECLKPFEHITKQLSVLSAANAANVADLFPENATIVSLNQTCAKYETYKQCTKDVYKGGYCYNHKDHMATEILGFACSPATVAGFTAQQKCLEEVIKDEPVKQCVSQFVQTLRLLKDSGEISFGGLCTSIERFVVCIQPSVVSNCSLATFDLIK